MIKRATTSREEHVEQNVLKVLKKNTREENWIEQLSNRIVENWEDMKCCKKLRCFDKVDIPFLITRVFKVINNSQIERRKLLESMLTSSGEFHFNGFHVCSQFLVTSFHSSRDLQCSIKNTNNCKTKYDSKFSL